MTGSRRSQRTHQRRCSRLSVAVLTAGHPSLPLLRHRREPASAEHWSAEHSSPHRLQCHLQSASCTAGTLWSWWCLGLPLRSCDATKAHGRMRWHLWLLTAQQASSWALNWEPRLPVETIASSVLCAPGRDLRSVGGGQRCIPSRLGLASLRLMR